MSLNQNHIFDEKRYQLVKSLKSKGIKDDRILEAMNRIPRELLVDEVFASRAYEDNALPIKCNQTISQPYTVAYMTELLDVQTGMKVLEIGTGSGYQALLLFMLGADVFTVERHEKLFEDAKKVFSKFGTNINAFYGDGSLGLIEYAPFDRIIVTAAARNEPESLIYQLKIGGKLVVPIGDKDLQTMHLIVRIEEDKYRDFEKDNFKFVPLIGESGWKG